MNCLSPLLHDERIVPWIQFGAAPGTETCHHPVVRFLWWIRIGSVAMLAHHLNLEFAAAWSARPVVALLPKHPG